MKRSLKVHKPHKHVCVCALLFVVIHSNKSDKSLLFSLCLSFLFFFNSASNMSLFLFVFLSLFLLSYCVFMCVCVWFYCKMNWNYCSTKLAFGTHTFNCCVCVFIKRSFAFFSYCNFFTFRFFFSLYNYCMSIEGSPRCGSANALHGGSLD